MTFVYLDGLKRSKVDKISKKILKHFKYKKKLGPIKIITFFMIDQSCQSYLQCSKYVYCKRMIVKNRRRERGELGRRNFELPKL